MLRVSLSSVSDAVGGTAYCHKVAARGGGGPRARYAQAAKPARLQAHRTATPDGSTYRASHMIYVAFLLGTGLGAAVVFWLRRTQSKGRRRIPKEWPLALRPLVNSREKQVWIWLAKVMFDQQILIKLPVTRFTAPAAHSDAAHWYQLLNGVYCTFTLCNMDGMVIGCIDVLGPNGLSMGNQTLKHTLLSQCGVHYAVVDPANLPHLIQIRTAFLGEHAARGDSHSQLDSRLKNVSEILHATVGRQRSTKSQAAAQLDAALPNTSGYSESVLASGWEQNSFVTPLDSRAGKFR